VGDNIVCGNFLMSVLLDLVAYNILVVNVLKFQTIPQKINSLQQQKFIECLP
jgi:hypothetical protein